MNMTKNVAVALMAGLVSFGALAAKEVTKEQVASMHLEKIGTVTTSSKMAPMDAKRALSKKADEAGGKYFLVIEAREAAKIHATAEVYK